ncbi:MAG: Glu-tRNA(Gln) amidotransferase GatDE subunit E, partial [Candidatus Aenigmarchaeota archaeon]|nr:Glu-tRNA(Gln) amidotransferase GatDE subunit E [Candidatus Aenigmarchaeota archaeon]
KDKTTYAIFIPGFAGLLKRKITPTRTLGNEIASYVRVKSELKGIIHSDEELEKYKLSSEFDSLRKHLKAKKGDTLIIAVGDKDKVEVTMNAASDRINQLVSGVPKEVRKALDNGDSDYLRPISGSARLYPETDIPPIPITGEHIKKIKANLPELIVDKEKRMKKELTAKLNVSDEIIKQIIKSGRKELLDKLLREGFDAKVVCTTMTSTLTYLEKKQKVNTGKLTDSHFVQIFNALKKGKISKEAIPEVLSAFVKNPKADITKVTEKLGIKGISEAELSKIVKDVISKNKNLLKDPRGEKILMGLVMREVRGRADAGKVMQEIKKELR